MVTVTIAGRNFEVASYKLGAMIAAAPFIDAQKAREEMITARGTERTVVELFAGIADTVAILHVGIAKADPTVTLDDLIDEVDNTPEAYAALMTSMWGVLGKSGMTKKGEALAPPILAEAAGASETNSAESSSSLSLPA